MESMDQYKAWDEPGFHDSYMVEQLEHVYQKISQDPINNSKPCYKRDQCCCWRQVMQQLSVNSTCQKQKNSKIYLLPISQEWDFRIERR